MKRDTILFTFISILYIHVYYLFLYQDINLDIISLSFSIRFYQMIKYNIYGR